jgi:Domain of unknown function (DUF1707)/Cell wall-active antibiotics response 4TMS YvqF
VSDLELRASDADRDRTVTALREHSVAGRLTLEEFAERMEAAYSARTVGELETLTRDLPSQTAALPAERPARRPSRWIVALMSGAHRGGRWRVPEHTRVVAVMGGCEVDLRDAVIESPEVTLDVFALMGGADVVVPEGVEVNVSGLAIMGGKHYSAAKRPPPPGAPVVNLRVFTVMGGVNVRTRPSRRAALPA